MIQKEILLKASGKNYGYKSPPLFVPFKKVETYFVIFQ